MPLFATSYSGTDIRDQVIDGLLRLKVRDPGQGQTGVIIRHRPHARCGWIAAELPLGPGATSLRQHTAFFTVVHPAFYTIDNATASLDKTNIYGVRGPDGTRGDEGHQDILDAVSGAATQVWPMIAGPATAAARDALRARLGSPTRRAEHVTELVSLLTDNPTYAGLDINYEGLRGADANDFRAFLTELASGVSILGKKLSVAVGGITLSDAPNPDNQASDYNWLAQHVDVIHAECYDFHFFGGNHIGPVAPLGWFCDVLLNVLSTGAPAKFVAGMPNYGLAAKVRDPADLVQDPTIDHPGGLDWAFATLSQMAQNCTSETNPEFSLTTDHMTAACPPPAPPTPPCCSSLNLGRVYAPGRQPNCKATSPVFANDAPGGTPQNRYALFFDDLDSLEERLRFARNAGLGGAAYWTVGDELPGFFDMVRRHFVEIEVEYF
jgi:chitinase